eukprot:m.110002 g.110002  ORF g.110002 m.110002 type:complete len:117 (-) comp13383_c0_seq9:42-392(-)
MFAPPFERVLPIRTPPPSIDLWYPFKNPVHVHAHITHEQWKDLNFGTHTFIFSDAINTWLRLKMASEDLGFDRHLLLYDEDRASWYKEPPIASQKFNLFLCERTALELVLAVFGLA